MIVNEVSCKKQKTKKAKTEFRQVFYKIFLIGNIAIVVLKLSVLTKI